MFLRPESYTGIIPGGFTAGRQEQHCHLRWHRDQEEGAEDRSRGRRQGPSPSCLPRVWGRGIILQYWIDFGPMKRDSEQKTENSLTHWKKNIFFVLIFCKIITSVWGEREPRHRRHGVRVLRPRAVSDALWPHPHPRRLPLPLPGRVPEELIKKLRGIQTPLTGNGNRERLDQQQRFQSILTIRIVVSTY